MAADRRSGQRRRASERLADAVVEAAESGGRIVEQVAMRGSQSARRSAGMSAPYRARGTDFAASRRGRAAPETIFGEIADLTADVMHRVGDAFRDFAEHDRLEADEIPRLELDGVAGSTVAEDFLFSNTGATALKNVMFKKTQLLGVGADIDVDAISFKLGQAVAPGIQRVVPGGRTAVTIAVEIPDDAPAGVYHGVIAAIAPPPDDRGGTEAVGARALVALEVRAKDASGG
jgi:hypothetical protein